MGKSKELAELGQVVSQNGGNVGIGVEPEDWNPAFDALQIGRSTAVWSQNNYDKMWLTTNTYLGADGEFKHINNAPVTAYAQFDGVHRWSYADGGASGSNATLSEYMRIDTAGRVTMPYQPSFLVAKNNGNFTGSVDVVFNYTRHNIGGHYSTSTGRFTAPVDGVYAFDANIMTNDVGSSSGHQYWEFRVNGVSLMRSYAYHDTANTHKSYPLSLAVKLNAGDYINCHTDTNITYYAGNEFHTWFSGYLIG